MQILKANNYKSATITFITNSTRSLCVTYDDMPIHQMGCNTWNAFVNSSDFTLDYLLEQIEELMKEATRQLDYIIVYTNRTEDELQDFISKLDGLHKYHFGSCKEVLVACRP